MNSNISEILDLCSDDICISDTCSNSLLNNLDCASVKAFLRFHPLCGKDADGIHKTTLSTEKKRIGHKITKHDKKYVGVIGNF